MSPRFRKYLCCIILENKQANRSTDTAERKVIDLESGEGPD